MGFVRNDVQAQDSLFYARFQQNIHALNNLYYLNDSLYNQGEFYFNRDADFQEELKKNTLFKETQTGASAFFEYLDNLSFVEKQNLIRHFSFYENYFETELREAGLASELKYLAPALSAMNSLYVSENKHAGVWQLTHFQGILNGLQVNKLVDERFNGHLSTKAFIKQIQQNRSIFDSTELAVIAYFVGNTKLKNTLVRSGENATLSEILNLLPGKTVSTIAAYQALSVFLKINTFEYRGEPIKTDEVLVNKQLHFQQISQVLNIPEKQLEFLNPQYRYSIVPGDEKGMSLNLPGGKRDDFAMWIDSIHNAYDSTLFQLVAQKIEYAPVPNRQYVGEKVKDLEIEGKTKIKYSIKSGDVLGFIAEEYDVRVADLKYWNNIYNERRIQVGQKLDIFVDDENAEYYGSLQKREKKKAAKHDIVAQLKQSPVPVYKIPNSSKKIEHVVKSGESPYVIAKKYDGVTPEAILEWNGIQDARKIQIGQKLIIYLEQ